jgi:hypothetical protein
MLADFEATAELVNPPVSELTTTVTSSVSLTVQRPEAMSCVRRDTSSVVEPVAVEGLGVTVTVDLAPLTANEVLAELENLVSPFQ